MSDGLLLFVEQLEVRLPDTPMLCYLGLFPAGCFCTFWLGIVKGIWYQIYIGLAVENICNIL